MRNKKNKLNYMLVMSILISVTSLNQLIFGSTKEDRRLNQFIEVVGEEEENMISIVADDITADNIIDRLHNGNKEKLEKLEKEIGEVRDDDYESLNNIGRKYFENQNIILPRNPKLAKDWIRNWFKVSDVFPILIGKVATFNNSSLEYYDDYGVAITSLSNFSPVVFIEMFNALENEDITAKTQQVKNYDRRYTIVHELGHVIDYEIRYMAPIGMFEQEDEESDTFSSKKILKEFYGKIGCDEDIRDAIKKVSIYAGNKKKDYIMFTEAFAELVTDVFINGKEASELSKDFVRYLVNIKVQDFKNGQIEFDEKLGIIKIKKHEEIILEYDGPEGFVVPEGKKLCGWRCIEGDKVTKTFPRQFVQLDSICERGTTIRNEGDKIAIFEPVFE